MEPDVPQPNTRQLILEHAEMLMRRRGYAAFSYADLAAHLGSTKAAIHYHFPSKEILIDTLLMRCILRTRDVLTMLQQEKTPNDALRAYADIFVGSIEQDMLPICCASVADRTALPDSVQPMVKEFMELQIGWITGLVREGSRLGTLSPALPAQETAMLLFSAIEGGSILARGMQQPALVLTAFEAILKNLEVKNLETTAGVGKRRRTTKRSAA